MNVPGVRAIVINQSLLEAECVCKRYGERDVLNSASVRALSGTVTALLGRNGAGKSTLLSILVGHIAPDNGLVRLDGVGLLSASLVQLARRSVFFLPARDLLLPALSVGEQMTAARDRFGGQQAPLQVAELLGIADRLGQEPYTLSGGERRRAELAVALARDPRVLIADEPLRGITPIDAETILQALRAFAARGGSVVITGHQLPLLLPHVDRITWCHAGKTREFSAPDVALQDFAFRRDFLPV